MTSTTTSLRKKARFAGMLYFIIAVSGIYSLMFVASQILVQGDAVATSQNILSKEFLFRTGIFNNLFGNTIWLFLAIALYRLFKDVDKGQAKLMLTMVVIQIPTIFIIAAFNIASLMIFKGELLGSFELGQQQELAMLFLKINDYATLALEVYWGLWLFPFAILIYKSGFIPRIFGILLIIAGFAYIIDSSLFMLFPDYRDLVKQPILLLVSIGEISITLWLLIKGVKKAE